MNNSFSFLMLFTSVIITGCAEVDNSPAKKEEANKKVVLDFWENFLNKCILKISFSSDARFDTFNFGAYIYAVFNLHLSYNLFFNGAEIRLNQTGQDSLLYSMLLQNPSRISS